MTKLGEVGLTFL